MTQSKIKSIIGTLVVLGVIVAWASGNKGPQDTTRLKYDEDDVSNCSNSCQTREVTYYGCQNANQEECVPYRKYGGWKSGTCVWLEGFDYYCDADDESDEGGDGGDDGGDNGDGGCGDDGCGSGWGDDDCYDGCY